MVEQGQMVEFSNTWSSGGVKFFGFSGTLEVTVVNQKSFWAKGTVHDVNDESNTLDLEMKFVFSRTLRSGTQVWRGVGPHNGKCFVR